MIFPLSILLSLALVASSALGADIYVAQNPTGNGSGSDSSDCLSLSALNAWTNVHAGDTVHLVGTLTNTLNIGGSGTAGNPVTILFEAGASFTAPYWSPAAIVVGSHTNILIDGGVNGLIQATANGTGLAYTNTSRGVYIGALSGPNNPFNVTVQNLTISNMYVRTPGCTEPSPGDQNNATTQGIQVYGSQISVVNCLVDGAEVGINVGSWGNSYTTNYGINIVGNQLYRNCICLALGGGGNFTNCCLQNVNLVSNRLDHWSAWSNPAMNSDLHLDGMYLFLNSGLGANTGTCTISNVVVSHNWFGPDVFAYTTTTNLVINVTNQPADGDTLTLTVEGTARIFRFKNTPALATDVQIGATPSLTADNLKAVLKTFYDYLPQRGNNAVVNFTWKVTDSTDACSQSGKGLQLYGSGPIHPNNTTATLFMTWYTADPNVPVAFNFKVFNNIFVWTNTSDTQTPWAVGFISCNAWGDSIIANNTVISKAFFHKTGYTYGQATAIGSANTPLKIHNNFTLDCAAQYNYDHNTLLTNFNPGLFFDYNCWGRPFTAYVPNNNDFYAPPASTYQNTNTLVIGFVSNITNNGSYFTNAATGQNCFKSAGNWYLSGGYGAGTLTGVYSNSAVVGTYTNTGLHAAVCVMNDTAANSDRGYAWANWTNTVFYGVSRLFDQHSTINAPLINTATYQPLPNDTVLVNAGTNLTSWGIVNDFYGNPRPATGPWTIGAVQTTSGVQTLGLLPPTNIRFGTKPVAP